MSVLIPLMVAVPLGAGFVMALLPGSRQRAGDLLAVATGMFVLAGAAALSPFVGSYAVGGWDPPVGIEMSRDGFSGLVLVVTAIVALAVILYATASMRRYTSRTRFLALIMLLLAAMNGTLLSGDIFNRYVFVEIAAIASYVLVGFACGANELKAALKYAVLGAVASIATLLGIALVYSVHGTVNIAHLGEKIAASGPVMAPDSVVFMAAVLMLAGFTFKAGLMPLHVWQPDALDAATAPVSAIISGCLVQTIGVYAMIRTAYAVFGATAPIGWIMVLVGVLSMAGGAIAALQQDELRRVVTYTGISQLGYVVCAFGLGGILASAGNDTAAALAVLAALFHLANHAVFQSLLFLNAGAVEYAGGGSGLTKLAGLAGTLSSSAVPPFGGFVSKAMIVIAFVMAGYYGLAAVAVAVAALIPLAFWRVRSRPEHPESTPRTAALPAVMTAPLAVLSALCLAGGLMALPALRSATFEPAGQSVLRYTSPGTDAEQGPAATLIPSESVEQEEPDEEPD